MRLIGFSYFKDEMELVWQSSHDVELLMFFNTSFVYVQVFFGCSDRAVWEVFGIRFSYTSDGTNGAKFGANSASIF
jgi:hypothetical protein